MDEVAEAELGVKQGVEQGRAAGELIHSILHHFSALLPKFEHPPLYCKLKNRVRYFDRGDLSKVAPLSPLASHVL